MYSAELIIREGKIIGFTIPQEHFVLLNSRKMTYERATLLGFVDECKIKRTPLITWYDKFGNWHLEIADDKT